MVFADTDDFDDDFSPPPPPPLTDEHDCKVAMIIQHFHRAYEQLDGGDVAWALEYAVGAILHAKMDQHRLSTEDRDLMLKALTLARIGAVNTLPDWCDRAHVAEGFDAVSGLIIFWSEDSARRRLREPLRSDWNAYAQVLKNLARNASLLDDIETRAERRFVSLAIAA